MLHSLFASLEQSSALSREMQFKMCYREEFDICQIHHIDKICLEPATIKVPITPKIFFRFLNSLYGIRKNAAKIFAID